MTFFSQVCEIIYNLLWLSQKLVVGKKTQKDEPLENPIS